MLYGASRTHGDNTSTYDNNEQVQCLYKQLSSRVGVLAPEVPAGSHTRLAGRLSQVTFIGGCLLVTVAAHSASRRCDPTDQLR